MWVGTCIGTLVMAWLTRGAWTITPVAGGDVMFHVIRADVGIEELLVHGRIHGWSPRMYLGTDLFLFYGPGFVWMMALVRLMALGLLDNGAALTVVTILSFLALPAAGAFLARSLRLSYRAAGIAALLSPLVSSMFGVGSQAVFGVGLVSQQAGAVLWILCLGSLVRMLQSDHQGWVVGTALLFALHALTSPVSVAGLAAVSLVAVSTIPSWPLAGDVLKRLVISGAAAFGLLAFWAIPALAHSNLSGVPTYWGAIHVPDLVGRILTGKILFPVGVGAAVVVSLIWMTRRRHFAARFLWVAPVVYLGLEALAMTGSPLNVFVAAFRNHRTLGLIGLLLLLPLAWAVEGLVHGRIPRKGQLFAWTGILLIVVLAQPSRLDTPRPQDDPIPQAHETARILGEVVPDGARFAYAPEGDHWTTLGVQAPNLWLAQVSGRNLLNGVGLETTKGGVRGLGVAHDIPEVAPERSSRALIELGTTHVVTVTSKTAQRLAESGLFEIIWEDDPMAVLAVLPSPYGDAAWGLTGRTVVSAQRLRVDSDNLMYLVEATGDTSVDLALAWSPHWRVRVDGVAVESVPTGDWRTRIPVSAGTSVIDLQYRLDGWEHLGLITTISTIVFLVWRRRDFVSAVPPTGGLELNKR